MYNNYAISGDQMKAIKAVEKAMKNAEKLGVAFWDNYGTLTAYNANEIHQPVPDESAGEELNYRHVYGLTVKNFGAGNADDTLYVNFK